jgi:hypothetical protein
LSARTGFQGQVEPFPNDHAGTLNLIDQKSDIRVTSAKVAGTRKLAQQRSSNSYDSEILLLSVCDGALFSVDATVQPCDQSFRLDVELVAYS